jgi:hypothetical protein
MVELFRFVDYQFVLFCFAVDPDEHNAGSRRRADAALASHAQTLTVD